MRFSRCSRGIAALAVVLALLALFFDALPAALVSGGLVVFISVRGVLFLSGLSSAAGSLAVHRSLSPLLVRQGTAVTVVSEGRITVPPGCAALVTDLPPHGAVVSGSPAVAAAGDFRLDYAITPLVTGEHPFRGVMLSFSDPFFATTLTLRTGGVLEPSLAVLPSTEFPASGRERYGERESAALSALKSPEIRVFREYLPGDDPRQIDWKLSAKYDTLYVREYLGRAEYATLLAVDLPDAALPYDREAFERLKEAAASVIIARMQDRVPFSVLLVSGPNVVSYAPLDRDPQRLLALITKLAPVSRMHSLYRYRSTGALKRRISALAASSEPFVQRLSALSAAHVSHRLPHAFEVQVSRVFQAVPGSSAHLFTLADRDTSHLRILSEQATLQGVRLEVHVPKEVHDPARLGQSRAAPVVVV